VTLEEIREGMLVQYIPGHARGDRCHPDCEVGRVISKDEIHVLVSYGPNLYSEETDPGNLVRL
jgi:hypothetical protein